MDFSYDERLIRAKYDDKTITVYQAFNRQIAKSATNTQTFVSPPFKMNRMTWIKPSFLWMMYRSGWASKENQEHILAIKIKREGWEWALKNSCLTHYSQNIYSSEKEWRDILSKSPVRIQWDPEKDINFNNLEYRSIQVGLTGIAVKKYINEWIVNIKDITEYCKLIEKEKDQPNKIDLPSEKIYPLTKNIVKNINATY